VSSPGRSTNVTLSICKCPVTKALFSPSLTSLTAWPLHAKQSGLNSGGVQVGPVVSFSGPLTCLPSRFDRRQSEAAVPLAGSDRQRHRPAPGQVGRVRRAANCFNRGKVINWPRRQPERAARLHLGHQATSLWLACETLGHGAASPSDGAGSNS